MVLPSFLPPESIDLSKLADSWVFRFRKSVVQVKERGDLSDQRADGFEKMPQVSVRTSPRLAICGIHLDHFKKDPRCYIYIGVESGLWWKGSDGLVVLSARAPKC